MSKYKPGDKFLIEIEGVNQESTVSKFVDYKINGSDLAVYEGYLDKLKMIKPDEIEKVGYEDGLKDAFYAAKMIEFDVKEGGIGSNNLMKIFGYSSLKSIIFNFKPKEIVEKIKEYEKDKKVRVGDVLRNKIGVIKHIRRWNYWRKYNSNGRLHKLLVLLGVIKSPTMVTVLLPEEKVRYFCIDKYIVRRCKETISPLSKDGRQKGETK